MATKKTILVVDDNPDDIEIMRIALAEGVWKVKLEEARCGEAACELLRTGDALPDVIFLDLKTPGMSGIDTLRQIRSDERLQHIPVIMISASSYEADQKAAAADGADAFLFKAFDLDQFSRDLNSILQRYLR